MVIAEFAKELKNNVLCRTGEERVNYFFLITNVPSSKDALEKIDQVRRELLKNVSYLHADVWWKERVTALLDSMPSVWKSFPEIFAGGTLPLLGYVVSQTSEGLPRSIRMAISHQYAQDKKVKFRQIELEKTLAKLFVDLDIDVQELPLESQQELMAFQFQRDEQHMYADLVGPSLMDEQMRLRRRHAPSISALGMLLHDNKQATFRKVVLQGGPGQGKSTITQMAVQIYRQQVLAEDQMDPEGRWSPPEKSRLPFRIELRKLAEWLNVNPGSSIESYLSMVIGEDSGGNTISVNDIQTAVEKSPVLLIFDGLDEIGSDKLRDDVLRTIMDCINRFENDLKADLRVIVTTRPPALAGRAEILSGFERLSLAPMEKPRIDEYIKRWLSVQIQENDERTRIRESYERRQDEPHVQALARNPMQLSVLLQFIRLKGEAFPDRRAELYREYFQIVIDRDVEKSSQLRENRLVIQALHEFIGYKIHALTEVNQADRTLDRGRLIDMVGEWLKCRGDRPEMAQQFFKLGEERFGLVVASSGEGEETRYGYEVQPIQEYFAAAYISNQMIESGAHDDFEHMIHRPYWREVALFLAGLRRPNEKADLILRARNVDQEKQLGWRQDGRAIILQLLQEGVFSEPPYVYSQALEFMLDLLDTRKLKVQREPPGLLGVLDVLMDHHSPDQHKERVMGLLKDYETCTDDYVVMRLYRVAGQLLRSGEYLKAALSYRGKRQDIAALIRLAWPYRREIDVQEMSRDCSFWQGVSDQIWAQTWWREAIRSGVALDVSVPAGVHQHLLEEFAATGAPTSYFSPHRQPFIRIVSRLAVWKMYRNQQILQVAGLLREPDGHISKALQDEFASVCENSDDVDYTGLDEPVCAMVKDIVRLSNDLIAAFCTDDGEKLAQQLERYTEGIRHYLQDAGLTAWIACQCAVNLIVGIARGRLDFPSSRKPSRIVDDRNHIDLLTADIRPFYVTETRGDADGRGKKSEKLNFLTTAMSPWSPFRSYRQGPVLTGIRLEQAGKCVALADILANSISHRKDLPFG
ncbi:MAG: NACHT domain-containing protein, partial [Caldisericia bacterium]